MGKTLDWQTDTLLYIYWPSFWRLFTYKRVTFEYKTTREKENKIRRVEACLMNLIM